ncbi:MAG TPA: energy transducer TonB [Gammaproteobacteria bacterium]|nr:energy transducer TonB [Gammaproteobacteria bacterium]
MNSTVNLPPWDSPSPDRLALTLFIATAFHALVILGISFNPFDREPPEEYMPTLDITVVNPSTELPPEEYDYLAESSQQGAGNTREKVKAQQQMLAQTQTHTSTEAQPEATRQLTRDSAREKLRDQQEPQEKPEPRNNPERINRTREMLSLNESIQQNLQIYSKRLEGAYITASTREARYASYMRDWVRKIERVGQLNYPDAARRQGLSGKLTVEVTLYPDGSVRNITILRPSGYKILDDAAVRIVKLAAPFAPFPESIRKDNDVLHITRTWIFSSRNRLTTRP